jgi:hypothetical protein
MLVALGYNADVENYVGDDWDLYVNVQANQDGLYVDLLDVADLTTANLTREHTAQMVWNMLQAYTIKQTSSIDRSDGSVSLNYAKSDNTMFWDSYRGIYGDGIMKGFKHTDGKWTYYIDFGDYYIRDEAGARKALGTIAVKNGEDYTAWLGQSVKVAFNADDRNATFKNNNNTAYGIFHDEGSVKATANFGDLGKLSPNDDVIDIAGGSYRLASSVGKLPVYTFTNAADSKGVNDYTLAPLSYKDVVTKVTENGVEKDVTEKVAMTLNDIAGQDSANNAITKFDHFKFNAIDQDDDGSIDFLLVVPYDVAKVTSVNGSKIGLNVLYSGGQVKNTKEFVEDCEAYDGVKRDDWVIYTPAQFTLNDKATIVKADLISGEISKANDRLPKDTALCTIDGTQYTFSNYFDLTMGNASELCKVGNKLNNAVVYNNFIFAVDNVKKAAITDYALVTAIGAPDSLYGAQAKLLFWNGESKIVDTDIAYDGIIDVGTLVIYSRNADGEYILDPAEVGNNDYVVDWSVYDGVNKSNSSDNVGYLEGLDEDNDYAGKATINDDAVIFVRYEKDHDNFPNVFSYKVITGKQLKLNEYTDIIPDRNAEINSLILGSNYNNVNYVELAYLDIAPRLEDSDTLYAYILDGSNGMETSANRGDTVKGLDLWTANGFQHLQFAGTIKCLDNNGDNIVTEYGDTKYKALEPGMVIKYKVNQAGDINEILGFYKADAAIDYNDSNNTNAATVAISALNPISFDYIDSIYYARKDEFKYWDISDATILYVDNTKQVGVPADGQSLYTAVKHDDSLVENAMIIFNDKGVVSLIVVDVDNEIEYGRPLTSQAD